MGDLAKFLIAKYFPESLATLVAGGVPISRVVAAYGTPLFLYDRSIIDRKYDVLRAALPGRFSIYYSIKANPSPFVVRHLLNRGCGIEIASSGELRRAVDAGCAPRHILFAGPGKLETELELAVSQGIGEIHIESLVEAERIAAISRRLKHNEPIPVAIRINPSGEVEGGAMRMGGRPAPFGVDEEILDEVLTAIFAQPELNLCGIHLFTGTQILDAATLLGQYRHALRLGRRVVARLGRPLRTVDFGGGLGIPYFAHERELDLEALGVGLRALCAEVDSDADFTGTQFIVEPGRFLTAEAGIYVARINDIKVSRGKKFIIVDGGMHHHLAASGNLGQTIKRNYPIAVLNKLAEPAEEEVDVVGPLCTPLDTLARAVKLPHTQIGDLIGIFQSGAYGLSASPQGFLSHPAPPEVFLNGSHDEGVICHRGASTDGSVGCRSSVQL